jgi:hypothetical protein
MKRQIIERALLMLVSVMTMSFAYAETVVTVNGLRYSLSGAYASVKGIASANYSNTITVPATIRDGGLVYTVNAIGSSAFSSSNYPNNQYVKVVILPNTIETIESYAFSNSNITKVTLQEGIKTIMNYAFCESHITELIIPSTVTTFGSLPFDNCNMLRTLIYLSKYAPSNWTATSQTYVPKKFYYSNPNYSINNASSL